MEVFTGYVQTAEHRHDPFPTLYTCTRRKERCLTTGTNHKALTQQKNNYNYNGFADTDMYTITQRTRVQHLSLIHI